MRSVARSGGRVRCRTRRKGNHVAIVFPVVVMLLVCALYAGAYIWMRRPRFGESEPTRPGSSATSATDAAPGGAPTRRARKSRWTRRISRPTTSTSRDAAVARVSSALFDVPGRCRTLRPRRDPRIERRIVPSTSSPEMKMAPVQRVSAQRSPARGGSRRDRRESRRGWWSAIG